MHTTIQQAVSTNTSIKIYPYRFDDIPSMLALARAALGYTSATPMTSEFWAWKHHANPFGDSYGIYAYDELEASTAGMRILMRWQFDTVQGQKMRGARAVDTATHPHYQRQSIFSNLTRQAIGDLTQEGVDFIYNTPNQKSLLGYLKMGWQVVAHWPLYVKVLRPWRMLSRRIRLQRNPDIGSFTNYFKSGIMNWSAFIQTYGAQLPDLIAKWEAERTQIGLRTIRSLDYLDWRYGQHPTVHYGVYTATEPSGRLIGFAILRPNMRYGWQEVVLTELVLAQVNVDTGVQMLRELTRQVGGDYLIAHFAKQTLEWQLLSKGGFLRLPRLGMTFTVRPLQTGLDMLAQPTQWDLTLGDLEIF